MRLEWLKDLNSGDGMENVGFRALALGVLVALAGLAGPARAAAPPATAGVGAATGTPAALSSPLLELGPGDEVSMRVFGQPDMDGTMYVADDGTVRVPLAGPVSVAGLSPSQAARKVEAALRQGQYLVDPHVTFTIVKSQSQKVSVLGEVHAPGIYTIESNTTLLELLAQAGGTTENGSDTVYILREDSGRGMQRLAVNLQGLAAPGSSLQAAQITLHGGDQVYVPRAAAFYITGQVHEPGRYRLDPGITVLEAVARAGGITDIGSTRRIVIKRRESDGSYRVISAKLSDSVRAGDVITVKERVF